MIPLWFKLAYTVFALAIVVIWLRHYGAPRRVRCSALEYVSDVNHHFPAISQHPEHHHEQDDLRHPRCAVAGRGGG